MIAPYQIISMTQALINRTKHKDSNLSTRINPNMDYKIFSMIKKMKLKYKQTFNLNSNIKTILMILRVCGQN